ncbi:hypothetical protein E8E13_010649 [Curvularia kusanoi]|uniref:Serine hydrolase domain-containing protein n=1 Tax=Curvularia kusanoi TaxID=90978 RepID=A0A9P4TP59_CURKU|nr:hypothetical protein E8E13_010649 [Curvularia kusanoi]
MIGPFYCWYKKVEPGPVKLAHELLHEIIEEEGPFDGVIAFSQGASLAMSMLMDQELNNSGSRPIFTFAALFSCPIVLSPDTKLNRERLREATVNKGDLDELERSTETTKEAPKYRFSLLLKENQRALANEYRGILDDAKQAASEIGVFDSDEDSVSESAGSDSDEELSHIPRLLHPLTVTARVSVPTVHLYDPKDAYHKQHELATRLCDKFLMQEVKHDGGHGLPMDPKQVKACAAAIVKAAEKGRQRINMF